MLILNFIRENISKKIILQGIGLLYHLIIKFTFLAKLQLCHVRYFITKFTIYTNSNSKKKIQN